jgi:hypothetical protein
VVPQRGEGRTVLRGLAATAEYLSLDTIVAEDAARRPAAPPFTTIVVAARGQAGLC